MPDRLDRRPARAKLDAERVRVAVVRRKLTAMVRFDPVAREHQRLALFRRQGRIGRGDLSR